MRGHSCLIYSRIWKAANDGIRKAMRSSPAPPHFVADMLADKVSMSEMKEVQRSSLCRTSSISFTFVREPLSHFLSGFAEYWVRSSATRVERIASQAASRDLLLALLQGHRLNGSLQAYAHMFLMAGVVASGLTFDFVGTLEAADRDWAKLRAQFGNVHHLGWLNASKGCSSRSCGGHVTSLDPHGARRSMATLLSSEPDLRYELCRRLEPDYTCFGFDIQACFNGSAMWGASAQPSRLMSSRVNSTAQLNSTQT